MRRKHMRVASSFLILTGLFTGGLSTAGAQTPAKSNVAEVVKTYCSGCHNGSMRSPSGALLDQFDATQIAEKPDVWARAYRQRQAGTMPPVGSARPDRATNDSVLTAIEQTWVSNLKPPAAAPATSLEIAERLAALLWNSSPDATLFQVAQVDRLREPGAVERQIHRMLA